MGNQAIKGIHASATSLSGVGTGHTEGMIQDVFEVIRTLLDESIFFSSHIDVASYLQVYTTFRRLVTRRGNDELKQGKENSQHASWSQAQIPVLFTK
jgi:hypothetical protein